jgi:hypothetical protein
MEKFPQPPPPAPRSNRRLYVTVGALAALMVVAVVIALIAAPSDPPSAASLGASPSPSLSVCERFPELRACGGEGYETTTAAPYTGPQSNANANPTQGSEKRVCAYLDIAIKASHVGSSSLNDAKVAASNNNAAKAVGELRKAAAAYKLMSDAMARWSRPVSRHAITVSRLLRGAAGYITNGNFTSAGQAITLAAVPLEGLSEDVKSLASRGTFSSC